MFCLQGSLRSVRTPNFLLIHSYFPLPQPLMLDPLLWAWMMEAPGVWELLPQRFSPRSINIIIQTSSVISFVRKIVMSKVFVLKPKAVVRSTYSGSSVASNEKKQQCCWQPLLAAANCRERRCQSARHPISPRGLLQRNWLLQGLLMMPCVFLT